MVRRMDRGGITQFIEKLCEYDGTYINVCWRSIKATHRQYGCAEIPKDVDRIFGHIESLDTDWYVRCFNDAGYYMQALDVDHDSVLSFDVEPDYSMETSPGHRQFIWLLDKQIPLEEWQNHQRELVGRYDADGCSKSRLFFPRIPYTFNHRAGFQLEDA